MLTLTFCLNLCPVKSRFIWIYASFQFALVVLFAHIFYSLVTDFHANHILITRNFHFRKWLIILILNPDSLRRITIETYLYFSLVICHLQVHVQAVLSILLATFAGFGVVMSVSSFLVELFRWRRRRQASSEQQHGPLPMTQAVQQPRPSNTPRSGESNHNQSIVQNQQDSNQSWIDICVLLCHDKASGCRTYCL